MPSTSPALVTSSTRRRRRASRAADRCRGLDRDLERRRVVRAGLHVEHDRGARAPARFVLADHQLTGARGRAPVHAAQVVAELVLAERDELVAEVAHDRAARTRLVLGADAAPDGDRQRTMSCTRGRTTSSASPALGSLRRATPNGSVTAIASGPTRYRPRRRVGMRYAARAVAPAASGGTRNRAARAAFVEPVGGGEQGSGAGARGSRPAGRCGPREPTCSRSGCTRRLTASVSGAWNRSQPAAATTSTSAAIPTTSISLVPEQVAADHQAEGGTGERPPPTGERGGAVTASGPTGTTGGLTARSRRAAAQTPVAPGTGTDARIPRTTSSARDAAQLGVGREEQPVLEHRRRDAASRRRAAT